MQGGCAGKSCLRRDERRVSVHGNSKTQRRLLSKSVIRCGTLNKNNFTCDERAAILSKDVRWVVTRAKGNHSRAENVIGSLLDMSSVPYSTYVPLPVTFLHRVMPELKLLWVVGLLFLLATGSLTFRLLMTLLVSCISVVALPERLWKPQLLRVGVLSLLVLVMTACGSDGVPPVVSPRTVSAVDPGMDALGSSMTLGSSMSQLSSLVPRYRYTVLNLGIFSVTKRSFALAVTLSSLTLVTLQTASLCLVSTSPERMAAALRTFLYPLSLLGVPIQHIYIMLLLSLRFMATVFEEMRNLVLAIAARGIDWSLLGGFGTINVVIKTCTRLFKTLMKRSDTIAAAMTARGFSGPSYHRIHVIPHIDSQSAGVLTVDNACCVGLFLLCCAGALFIY
eukprot:jgi/Picsp_1/329/NSC_00328-R1_cobalt transport protein